MNTDPIQQAEKIIKGVHDSAGKYTQPVLKRYPLVFAFLVIFSVSAIMKGFGDLITQVAFFKQHPAILMVIGIVVLLLTGKLYKWLQKGSE
jgi:hypothetical protein